MRHNWTIIKHKNSYIPTMRQCKICGKLQIRRDIRFFMKSLKTRTLLASLNIKEIMHGISTEEKKEQLKLRKLLGYRWKPIVGRCQNKWEPNKEANEFSFIKGIKDHQ